MKRKVKWLRSIIKNVAIPIIIFCVFLMVLVKSRKYFGKINEIQSLELLKQSVNRATIECYAIEGIYPSELEYLEENYGVVYDENKYGVEYGCFASNIMPTIVVYEK